MIQIRETRRKAVTPYVQEFYRTLTAPIDDMWENGIIPPSQHYEIFENDFIDNKNTHGTGCTLSSAIAANLALGDSVEESVKKAKNYVYSAISSKIDLGNGKGPIDHMYKFNLGGKN